MSGLRVGLFAFQSNLLNPTAVDFYQSVSNCYLAKDGVALVMHNHVHEKATERLYRYYNKRQTELNEQSLSDCQELKDWIGRQGEGWKV